VFQLGVVTAALNDISAAISQEPLYVDAYWQRHLVYVVLSRHQQALDDLNVLLWLKEDHVPALKSRLVENSDLCSYLITDVRGMRTSLVNAANSPGRLRIQLCSGTTVVLLPATVMQPLLPVFSIVF